MLGFSREVARDVTHPLWPSRVPLRISVSVILRDRVEDSRLTDYFEVEYSENVWWACNKRGLIGLFRIGISGDSDFDFQSELENLLIRTKGGYNCPIALIDLNLLRAILNEIGSKEKEMGVGM
jgi:hypothetical protein